MALDDGTDPGRVADDLRPHRPRGLSAVPLLVALGLAALGAAFVPSALPFLERNFGLARLGASALGLLFLYVAFLARDVGRLRERLLDLMEEILKVHFGPEFRRERQAIDILVKSMASERQEVRHTARGHLVRLTGQDQGADAAAWSSWWGEHRSSFRSQKAAGGAPPQDPRSSA